MQSTNWAEVNLMRWVEGELTPVGGQSQYDYQFASRCKAIHGWYDLNATYHVAYLCESNLYVDTGGTLTEITPTGGLTPPSAADPDLYSSGLYSDGFYSDSSAIPPISNLPNAWSLDNFGSILLAMSSVDGRLLKWDPGVSTTIAATTPIAAAFAIGATTITMSGANTSGAVHPGMNVLNQSTNLQVGTVSAYIGSTLTLTAGAASASAGPSDVLVFSSTTGTPDAVASPVTSGDTGTGFAPGEACSW